MRASGTFLWDVISRCYKGFYSISLYQTSMTMEGFIYQLTYTHESEIASDITNQLRLVQLVNYKQHCENIVLMTSITMMH